MARAERKAAERIRMDLSKRLTAVASLVTAGYTVADIGTDHAYIPIYLVENGRIPRAVAMDVNRGPLERASENIRAHGLTDQIQTRLSDGFSALECGEADCAVIAGMGGGLTIRILKEGADVVQGLKECILQPQSEIEKVRAFLSEKGFLLIREDMAEEDGKYYPMMKVRPPAVSKETVCAREADDETTAGGTGSQINGNEKWSETELRYGPLLLRDCHPVLREYLLREIRIREQILRGLKGNGSERAEQRIRELEQELEYAGKGMEYYAVQRDHTGN